MINKIDHWLTTGIHLNHLDGWRLYCAEFIVFGVKQARACLFAGLFFFPPMGLVIGPFVGAFIGALVEVKGDNNRAVKVALGSFLGFVSGSLLKVIVSVILFGYSIYFLFL